MYSEARKIHVIEEVIKVQSDDVLIEVEALLVRKNAEEKNKIDIAGKKPSDYAGCISTETANTILHEIEKSRNEWERDI